LGLGPVLLWTVFARIVRMAPVFAVAAGARVLFRRSIDARPALWCAVLGTVWFVFYVLYFLRMSRG
jgi:hypothetical protein